MSKITDAEFTVINGPTAPPKPRRRIYLARDWWLFALISGVIALNAAAAHHH